MASKYFLALATHDVDIQYPRPDDNDDDDG
jgi:hypothetical protein